MRNLVVALTVTFALVLGVHADAQVLNFDNLAPTANPILVSLICANPNGFRFDSGHFHLVGLNSLIEFAGYSSNNTTHIGYDARRGFPIVMSRVGTGTFALLSFDAGKFYSVPVNDYPDAQTIQITGTLAGGGTVSHTVTINPVYGPNGPYEHFTLPATFVGLTAVTFTGFVGASNDAGIALDNISYQLAQPEAPSTCVPVAQPSDIPSVTLTNPVAGTVAGTIQVAATATDNVGVVSVQFNIDGVPLGAPDTTVPYTASWNTLSVADGPHTVSADARDAAGNVGTTSVGVSVTNTPIPGGPHYLDFDGVDDSVQVADNNALSFGTGTADRPLTMELWFKPDTMGREQLLGKWGEDSNQEYRLQIAAGASLRFDLRDQSAQATTSVYTSNGYPGLVGSWHHLAVTYDGRGGATAATGITLYLDGVAVPLIREGSAAYVAMENLAEPLRMGREGPGTGWHQYNGALDEVRLWSVARTPSQVQAMMNIELTGTEPGLVGYWRFNEGLYAVSADASPSANNATLLNGPTWLQGGPLTPDTTAPVITNVQASVTQTSATVAFQTSEVTTAVVSYTAGTACPCIVVASPTTGTAHTVTLNGLTADTPYQLAVQATDPSGNVGTSAVYNFRTAAPPAPAPTVTLTNPTGGTVLGTIQLQATASSTLGIASVQFSIDGVALGAPDTTAPYSVSWNTTTVADGTHTITALARDGANNPGTASVTVLVRNSPVVATPYYVDFDGTNDLAQAPDADSLSFGTGTADRPLTLELWFRPDTMGRAQLVGKWGEGANQEYRLQIAAGASLRFDLRDQSAQATTSVYTSNGYPGLVGGWHHLAVTYDGRGGASAATGLTLYLDGVAVPLIRENAQGYVAMENLTEPLRLATESSGWNQFNGALDEVRFWNVVRTPSQLLAAMGTELTGTETGLANYWKFNESTGTTAPNTVASGGALTLLNGTLLVSGGPATPQ